jgi:hypothetical protein
MNMIDIREAIRLQKEYEDCRKNCKFYSKDGLVYLIEHHELCKVFKDEEYPDKRVKKGEGVCDLHDEYRL